MKFHVTSHAGLNAFSAYGEGFVRVGEQRYERSLIVTPDRVLPWQAASFEALTETDFAPLLELGIDILLLGTGARQRFPHPRLTRALAQLRARLDSDRGGRCAWAVALLPLARPRPAALTVGGVVMTVKAKVAIAATVLVGLTVAISAPGTHEWKVSGLSASNAAGSAAVRPGAAASQRPIQARRSGSPR